MFILDIWRCQWSE